jgi:hypothetical protein
MIWDVFCNENMHYLPPNMFSLAKILHGTQIKKNSLIRHAML